MTSFSLHNKPDLARGAAALAIAGWAMLTGAGCGDSGPAPGSPAPPFAYTLLDGSRHASTELHGRVVLVNFWATSCAPCLADMPRLIDIHQRFAARGLATLAVAVQADPPASVARYAESRALPFGVVIDNTGAVAHAFGDIAVTPTSVLIDRRGRVVRRWVGGPPWDVLQPLVEQLLAAG